MANDSTPQSAAQKQYAFAKQTTFGTIIADAAAAMRVHCEHWEVDRDIKVEDNPVAYGDRMPRESNTIVHYKRAMPFFTIAGAANHETLDHILYSATHTVTEAAATPYSKTYVYGTTQPAFTSNAGWFGTFFERDPAASKSTAVKDAICKSLTLSIKPGERLKYSWECVGRGLATVTSNPSGTWTDEDESLSWWFEDIDLATVNFGAGAINFNLAEFELKLSYDSIEAIGQDGAGSFQNYGLGAPTLEAKIVVVKDADYHSALSNFSGNTAVDARIGWGNATPGTIDGDLDFAMHGKIISTAKAHEAVMKGELNLKLMENDAGTTEAITIIMANATDRTW